jgi:squalene-hopene/tetraprenyl-beta-curcumene cyclase
MRLARDTILARGGASKSNVFTRVLLALYGVMSWDSVPVTPAAG